MKIKCFCKLVSQHRFTTTKIQTF